jgi:molybdopterin synthase catalytic subunit
MTEIALITQPILAPELPFASEEGAEAQFLGIVRGLEDGKAISGIEYSAYEPMALAMLHKLHEQATAEHGPHALLLQHRLGLVAVGEPSIIIRVRTKHSALSFTLCQWYLAEVKKTVPIWKRFVQ